MTMALPLDNPSYFSVSEGTTASSARGKFRLFRKKMGTSTSSQESGLAAGSIIPLLKTSPVATASGNRRQFRTLLRSVSSNSADSNQELLVLGEPRPSDIAPPSPCMGARRHTDPSTTKFTKTSDAINNDHVYSPLATSDQAPDVADCCSDADGEEEEVFFSEDSARYYNLGSVTTIKEVGRRHSVGTYLLSERECALSITSTKSFKEEFRQTMAQPTHDNESITSTADSLDGHHLKKRCNRLRTKGLGASSASMDDIVIISSKGSQVTKQWVDYFITYFEQISKQQDRPALKVCHIGIEEFTGHNGLDIALKEKIPQVKLQLIIICPELLDYIASNSDNCSSLNKLLRPDRTIAMLLGVTDEDIIDIECSAFETYRQWQRRTVNQNADQNFTHDFLATAMNIYIKVTRQQHEKAMKERTLFSVIPKKVNQSQNRMVILLSDPLTTEDQVKVSIDQNGELIEMKTVKKRNPYTLKFIMPDICFEVSSIVNVVVEKNGNMLGARPVKCESRLRELDQILRTMDNPLEFMCQTLGFSPSNKKHLDNWMVQAFQKNIPPHFNLIANHSNVMNSLQKCTNLHNHEEYPTLLHFAAKFDLEKLAWQLLELPGGDIACEIRNANDLTPAEIAENAGHKKLASTLNGYMQMTEFTDMYKTIKEVAKRTEVNDEDEYLVPRSAEQTYSIPPPARPVPSNSSVSEPCSGGYLEMQKSGRATPVSSKPVPGDDEPDNKTAIMINDCNKDDITQKELLEIINDFKNNIFSLGEAEQLVESWKNRNDVQKSFREKQIQLNKMREEYDRIQQKYKDNLKKTSPFDRLKRIFLKNKTKDSALNLTKCYYTDPTKEVIQNTHRPISSLSLQSTTSSTSSGRLSTISAISMGDSGTHSDPDERRIPTLSTTTDHEYYTISERQQIEENNYLIPPAPKPINKYTPGRPNNFTLPFTAINEQPQNSVPLPDNKESDDFYIHFPPSGRRVEDVHTETDYIKCDSNETVDQTINNISYDEDAPEYINIIMPRN